VASDPTGRFFAQIFSKNVTLKADTIIETGFGIVEWVTRLVHVLAAIDQSIDWQRQE
jgi:hypothetical protein